jgi:formylmethanofuran dehydrogenase subunit C
VHFDQRLYFAIVIRLGSLSSNIAVVGDVGSNPSVALNGDLIVVDVETVALIASSTLARC